MGGILWLADSTLARASAWINHGDFLNFGFTFLPDVLHGHLTYLYQLCKLFGNKPAFLAVVQLSQGHNLWLT